jgi:hypothetical protein
MSEQPSHFEGEDPNAGFGTPVMDLAAAAVLMAIGIYVMIESLRLPAPGGLMTAPGLLPFLTAASLCLMALMLARLALMRRRMIDPSQDVFELPEDFRRSLALGAIVVVYAAGLQFLPIHMATIIAGLRLTVGAFEVVSIIVLTAILLLYWRRPLWACLAVALVWIALLNIVFRMVFGIPLP